MSEVIRPPPLRDARRGLPRICSRRRLGKNESLASCRRINEFRKRMRYSTRAETSCAICRSDFFQNNWQSMLSNCSTTVMISCRCCWILTSTKAECRLRRSAATINIKVYVLIRLVWLEFVTSVFVYGIPVIGLGAQQLSNYLIQSAKNKSFGGCQGVWHYALTITGRPRSERLYPVQ